MVFSGGFPESDGVGPKTLTIQSSRSSHLLSFTEPILEFICLPSSPFVTGKNREREKEGERKRGREGGRERERGREGGTE